jgi:hypothetical protein
MPAVTSRTAITTGTTMEVESIRNTQKKKNHIEERT